MKKFTGYQKGDLNGKVTYKCWFLVTDAKGFTAREARYLSEEDFRKLPKVGEELR